MKKFGSDYFSLSKIKWLFSLNKLSTVLNNISNFCPQNWILLVISPSHNFYQQYISFRQTISNIYMYSSSSLMVSLRTWI